MRSRNLYRFKDKDSLERMYLLGLIRWYFENSHDGRINALEAVIAKERVQSLLKALPHKAAVILILRIGYGRPISQIAKVLNMPNKTVHYKAVWAVSMLRYL